MCLCSQISTDTIVLPSIIFCFLLWVPDRQLKEMSQLSATLQESERREREVTTIVGLLRQQMEMDGRRSSSSSRRMSRLMSFRSLGCCGAPWGLRPTTISVRNEQEEEEEETDQVTTNCLTPIAAPSGMNLAAALAAERQFREAINNNNVQDAATPLRMSLMRLLEETDGGEGAVNDTVCCVCMVRKKGAAFIPCGHTYCRVCSRELWLNRGSCPLCNRSILEILDIF